MNKKEIIINQSKTKRITYAVVFAVVTLIYGIMYRSNLLSRELGLVLVAFCAGLTLYFIYSVYFPKASIVINKDGIKQKAMRGKGPIKWEKISEIYICVIPKKKYDTYFLVIKYRKDENDTRKVKFKGKVDQKIGDVVLVIDELEMQPYDIYNKIQKYYSKFIRK